MYDRYITGALFILAIIFLVNSERSSGLYIDNGFDQTILHRILSQKQKRELENYLLDILDLPDRPRRIARRALLVKRSAPKFLLNIYQNLLSTDNEKLTREMYEDRQEFYFSHLNVNIIKQSDLIMTFGAHNPHSGSASKTNRGKRIWFDVSEVPRGEHFITAELWLYQGLNKYYDYNKTYTVAIYRVERTQSGGRIKHYIDAANTTPAQEGWITLNISRAFQYWVEHPKENRGLFLAVHHADYLSHVMRPDDIGIVGVLGIPDKQPFMVGFFESSNIRSNRRTRRKRSSMRKGQDFNIIDIHRNPYVNSIDKKKRSTCNIKTLYISFKDLQWQDWIIAPEGYDAYYCSGECNFPLNIEMNATNHAIVQTLVHLMKPNEVPKPLCVPTKLSSISVLYFLDDSNVVLKKYKNMVVNSCGCH